MRLDRCLVPALVAFACVACGGGTYPHVRFATASAAEIEAAQDSGQIVFYDFEAGDEVPLVLGLVGVARALTEPPVRLVAQRPFSIVLFPDGRTMFSFDGRRAIDSSQVTRWTIALGANEEGGRALLLMFIGQAQDLPEELR
ncbi:MAG: hypothetical protein ACFCGT_26545 [Sandaracinaceae bacterium]